MNNFDDLFLQAREISDLDARAAFLDEACAHQPELRARLDSLLADASAADAFFGEEDTVERVSQLVHPQDQDGTSRETRFTPTHIGPYRILERIGHGGMGDVFRAVQKEPIRREVALKLIKLGMDTQQVIARFEAERQALALMDHPHIARVLDAGADDLGHPYFVMELVRGVPITQYADEKQLTLRERLSLMQQVCQAIQHAHSKGVIHRDLKPSNILVSTQDGRPHAKVIDFGIAKATAQPLTDKTLFTQFQQFIGTPQYMSPEQAEGSLDIDTRADVYALGILLYELLTGGTPVEAATLRQAALHEIARIIKEQDTPKPSTRLLSVAAPARAWSPDAPNPKPHVLADAATPTTLSDLAKARSISSEALIKTVRGELDWLVMKALEKDRTRRYETPNQLSDDIARYLEGHPIVAAPPSSTYRMKKFIRKHRAPVLAAAAVLTLMTAGILGTSWGLVREKAAKEEATQQAKIADQERARAEAEKAEAQKQKTEADQQRLTAETAKTTAEREREAAELESYIGNLAAAQAALTAHDYPGARARLAVCPEKLRGWEWYFMSRQADAVIRVLPKHLTPLRFSPDAQHVLVFDGHSRTLKLQKPDGKPYGTELKLPDKINMEHLRLNNDATILLCNGSLFEFKSGRHFCQLYSYNDKDTRGPVVSPDMNWIACSVPPRLYRWDGSFRELGIPKDSKIIAFTPDSKACLILQDKTMQFVDLNGKPIGDEMELMVSGSEWDATKLAETDKRYDRSWKPSSVQFDKEGTKLVTSHPFGFCRLWSTAGAALSPWIENHTESAVLSPDGKLLVTYSRAIEGLTSISTPELDPREEGYFAIIRETSTGKELHRTQVYDPSREFSPDSKLLPQFIKGLDRRSSEPANARVYEVGSKVIKPLPHWRFGEANGDWTAVGFSGYKMIQVNSGRISIDHLSNLPQQTLPALNDIDCRWWGGHYEPFIELEFSTQEELVIIRAGDSDGFKEKSVILSLRDSLMPSLVHRPYYADSSSLELGSFEKGEELPSYRLLIKAIASDDLDEALVRTSKMAGLNLDLSNDRIRFYLPGQRDACSIFTEHRPKGVSLSPDFKRLAVATDEEISIWDTSTQRKLWRSTLSEPVDRIAFTADGRGLVLIFESDTASSDNRLEIWDGGRPSLLGDFHASALALMPQIERDFEQLWKRIEDGEFTNEKMITWLGQSGLSPLQQWLLLPELETALEKLERETNNIIAMFHYQLLAKPNFIMELKRTGIVTSVFSETILHQRLSKRVPSVDELCHFLASGSRPSNDPFSASFSPFETSNQEMEAALSLLKATEATSPRFHFFSTVFQYRKAPNATKLSKVHELVAQSGENESIFNAILASVLLDMGSVSEAKECIGRLLNPNESCVRMINFTDPFAVGALPTISDPSAEEAAYLIRHSNGTVGLAPKGFVPSGNCRQLSGEVLVHLRPVINRLLESEKNKPAQ
jgi:serine/threonine protein kinase/WD40 repeat protein